MRLRARGVVPGRASGTAIASSAVFSLVGRGDRATGSILDAATGIAGERLEGRIFAFCSEKVGTFRGRWSAISGHIEGRENPRHRAIAEVREETGLRGIVLRSGGDPVFARDGATMYVVHPFLFDVPSRRVRLDWENVEHRWIRPEELHRFDTVPRLTDVVAAILGPPS